MVTATSRPTHDLYSQAGGWLAKHLDACTDLVSRLGNMLHNKQPNVVNVKGTSVPLGTISKISTNTPVPLYQSSGPTVMAPLAVGPYINTEMALRHTTRPVTAVQVREWLDG